MPLDLQTLSVVTVFVTALLGALLIFAGLQNRDIRAPLWWGTAYIVNAGGIALLVWRPAIAGRPALEAEVALVLVGSGLIWAGARVFDSRAVRPLLVLVAPAIWLLFGRIPNFAAVDLRAALFAALLAALLALTAGEIWRGRDEALLSRWPAVVVLVGYAAVLSVSVPFMLLSGFFAGDAKQPNLSFALATFGILLFTVIIAFLQLNMAKERMELRHRAHSHIDPLSGIANRRAFLTGAERLLAQQDAPQEPIALLLFDLDRLKDINVRHGHAIGDAVLQEFAGVAAATLGADVLFARIGGAEFASCMTVGDLDEAYAIADRVRRNFQTAAARFGDAALMPSVSVGVALHHGGRVKLAALLSIVDRALYRAKASGRNRVATELPEDRAIVSAPSIVPIIDQGAAGMAARTAGRRWRTAS